MYEEVSIEAVMKTSVLEPVRNIPQKRRFAMFWKASRAECPLLAVPEVRKTANDPKRTSITN